MNLSSNLKKAKAGLLATLAIGTMAVASSVSPVNKIASFELVKTANAAVVPVNGLGSSGIQYAEVCNTGSIRVRVIVQARRGQYSVNRVDTKLYSRYVLGINSVGNYFGIASSEAWRPILDMNNVLPPVDRVYYDTGARIYPLQTPVVNTPVMISSHIQTTGGTIIDPGGIINFGIVPAGECRKYGYL
jgi:hypothetical protein